MVPCDKTATCVFKLILNLSCISHTTSFRIYIKALKGYVVIFSYIITLKFSYRNMH